MRFGISARRRGVSSFLWPGKQLRVDLEQIAVNAPKHEGRQARVEGQLVLYGSIFQLLATAVEFR